jgi:anionic cell wall polymer biosynthesis LytR-Cps2A-Psr (LCP) family protein
MVDLLGGVRVDIESGFTDDRYPILGRENDSCGGDIKTLCRWETVVFDSGSQILDGTTALKFARSRKADGDEGSDFARSARQQKIILALKEEVLSTDFLLNPKKLSQMLEIIESAVETDIPESHFGGFAKVALKAKDAGIRSVVLGDIYKPGEKDGFLINPPVSPKHLNQYVLVPRVDTWQPAQEWIGCLLRGDECPIGDFTKDIRD